MLGLRTKDNDRFIKYFNLVQSEAQKLNCCFFIDFGQCDDIQFKDMEVDRLFGWLIPRKHIDAFNKEYIQSKVNEKWDKYCSWVIPEIIDDKLYINFE